MRPAVFLDRDGTINLDAGFVHELDALQLFDGVDTALAALQRAGFLLIVVTNQSGIARGRFTEADMQRFNAHLNHALRQAGATIDAFYYCPYHPDASVPEYRLDSPLRKPDIGMFQQACRDFEIDVAASYMVGDRLSDIEFAQRCGLRPILVCTGHGADVEPVVRGTNVAIAADLPEAAGLILDALRTA